MENNIELFDSYIDGSFSADERQEFEARLKSDKDFAMDFRIYLLTVQGVCREEQQADIEFGQAMKNISERDLMRIIGRDKLCRQAPLRFLRDRLGWIASIAVIIVVGVAGLFSMEKAGKHKVDNLIVAYNYIPESNRGWESVSSSDLPALEEAYRSAPSDDLQAQEDAGMRLAMAYLKVHDRKRARIVLSEMSERFADDEEFAAQCRNILNQLK